MTKYLLICLFLILSMGIYAQDNSELYLNSIGIFSGQSIYLICTSLSTLADRDHDNDLEANDALKEVDIYIRFTRQSSEELNKLLKQKAIAKDNIVLVNDMIDCFSLLETEARSLESYMNKSDRKNLDDFEKNKAAAWEKISKLLKL